MLVLYSALLSYNCLPYLKNKLYINPSLFTRFQEQLSEQAGKLEKAEGLCEQANNAVRTLQDTASQREQETLQQQAHEVGFLCDRLFALICMLQNFFFKLKVSFIGQINYKNIFKKKRKKIF